MASKGKSMAKVYDLHKPVTLHSWNADRSMVAIVHNNEEVCIYATADKVEDWTLKYTLTNHDQLVSGLDWCAATNKILTCSHDRNGFVFSYDAETDSWQKCLVVLTLPRGATSCCWSPNGEKFVVTSAYKDIRVCTYDEENDWWCPPAGVKIKPDKSTVFAAAWHPNSQLIATGSGRKFCRVYSTYIEATGEEHLRGPFSEVSDFGVVITELDADGWVEGVAWSPSGYSLAYVAHDSSLSIITFAEDGVSAPRLQVIKSKETPCTKVLFLAEGALVATGHNMNPMLYSIGDSGIWEFTEFLDKKEGKKKAEASSSIAAARSLFSAKTDLGGSTVSSGITTKHTCAISDLRPYSTGDGPITSVSTSCPGGKLVVWDVATALSDVKLTVA